MFIAPSSVRKPRKSESVPEPSATPMSSMSERSGWSARKEVACRSRASAAPYAADFEADPAKDVGVEQVAGVDHDAALDQFG